LSSVVNLHMLAQSSCARSYLAAGEALVGARAGINKKEDEPYAHIPQLCGAATLQSRNNARRLTATGAHHMLHYNKSNTGIFHAMR